jgi:hypothetical protein
MRILTIAAMTLGALLAADKHDHKKSEKHSHGKSQKAHDHGAAELNIAIEGTKAEIELHAPAMGIVGFEYVPSTAADKKKQADALAALKNNISKVVIFDPALGCKITAKSVDINQEEPDHAEVDGDFQVVCAKPLAGSKVSFGMTKTYPAYATLRVQAVGASGQAGAEIKSDKGTLTLPN